MAVARAPARRGKNGSERTVFVKAEKQRNDDGQTAAAQYVRVNKAVLRAENEQCNKNPKGNVTLIATSHKNLLCFAAGDM
jgi:hypothetical protein